MLRPSTPVPQTIPQTIHVYIDSDSGESIGKVTFDKIAVDEQHYWGYYGGRSSGEVPMAGAMYK